MIKLAVNEFSFFTNSLKNVVIFFSEQEILEQNFLKKAKKKTKFPIKF